MKKKIFAMAFAALLVLNFSATANAAESSLEQAKKDVLEGIIQGYSTVSLREYNLREEQLDRIYDELYFSNQLPWYVDNYQFTYEEDTGKILTFEPIMLDESLYDRTLYEQAIAEILAETVHPGMSQLQIALSVHDYLAANYTYDNSHTYFEGYDLLIRGTAVCNGYAEAYMDLLKRAGVECYFVLSETMDHGWNQVKIGENWYHVDLTWDDSVPNVQGMVSHTYFLLSDTAITHMETPHYAYKALQTCVDTTYDGEDFWDTSSSRIIYESEMVTYLHKYQNETHTICRIDGDETKVLHEYDSKFRLETAGGTVAYTYETVGLGLVEGRLYFCSGDTVYSITTEGTDLREEHKEPVSEVNCILGCYASGGELHYTAWDMGETYTDKSFYLEGVSGHTHDYTSQRYEGSCEAKGGTEYTCQCGVSYRTEDQSAPGHDYVLADQKARGLLESGWETWECRTCKDEYTTTKYAIISEEFLLNRDTLPWLIGGAVVLLWIIKAATKKRS